MNDDTEVDNDINDDNLIANHDDVEVDDDVNNFNADHNNDALLRFCSINNIVGTVGFVPRALVVEELNVVSSNEQTSFTKAEHNPRRRKAMLEEMMSIEENNTWSLIDLPPGRKLIRVKWVFKVKRDEHEEVSKHKVRLMVKGYVKRHGINYDKVFTPVARLDSVRLLIALTAHEGCEVHHMDVKSAFLNDDLQESTLSSRRASSSLARSTKCSN
jgi:hypothetical protein